MTDFNIPVLIAGAGPIGLALALDLGRRGIRSIIVERDAMTGGELLAKAGVLNERSMEFCRMLGIADQVASVGIPDNVSRDTVYCTALNGHFIGRDPLPSTRERHLPPQCAEILRKCPQFLFDPLLAEAVKRQGMAEMRYGTQLEDFEQDDEGVTVTVRTLADDTLSTIRAQYLTGCDGAGSIVRRRLGIGFPGEDLGYSVSVMIEIRDIAAYHPFGKGERWMFIDRNGTWANLTSVDLKDYYRFTVIVRNKDDAPSMEEMDALLRRAFGREIPYEMRRVMLWRRSQCAADRFAQGRVFLAGDAAHTTSPTGGHGLNTGLGDVSDLGWILAALALGWGGAGLVKAYGLERRPVAIRNGAISTENYYNWVMPPNSDKILEDGPEGDALRASLGAQLKANLKQEWHSLGIAMGYSYADSPIVVPDGSPASPDSPTDYIQTARPGHRAPHHWLAPGKSMIDLFGDGFVLLRLGANPPETGAVEAAAARRGVPLTVERIPDDVVHELYERALVLVRPDGMVAWRGNALPENPLALIDQVRGAETP